MDLIISCVTKNYANFSGRAGRSEYWGFLFFVAVLGGLLKAFVDEGLGFYDAENDIGIFSSAFLLAMFIPSISVLVRRLHDIDKSGWWILIFLIPILGPVWLIMWCCFSGTDGTNAYGLEPK